MEFERVIANRPDGRAVDGFGDGKVGGVGVAGGDRAGGPVKIEVVFLKAVVVHDHGGFAAGQDGGGAPGGGQRRLIRFQLIVRHVNYGVLGQIGKAAVFDNGACARKDNFLQRFVIAEGRLADKAHACGNRDLGKLRTGIQIPFADGDQAVGQFDGRQAFAPANGAVPR